MGYPIELTDNERRSALAAVSPLLGAVALNRTQPAYALGPVVDAVVEAVNKSRAGDPVGTARRCEDGCCVALRVNRPEGEWQFMSTETHYNREFGDTNAMRIDSWPVIYSPEWST